MSTLYITELNTPVLDTSVINQPEVASQTVTVSGTTAASAAFQTQTNVIRIQCDGICSVKFGLAPTATTGNMRMTAGQTEYFHIPQGGAFKVAAITNT